MIDPSYLFCLQSAIDSPAIDFEKAYYILKHYRSLSSRTLIERVHMIIKQQRPLSRSMAALLAQSFKVADATKSPFEKLFPEGLTKRPQASEVAEGIL